MPSAIFKIRLSIGLEPLFTCSSPETPNTPSVIGDCGHRTLLFVSGDGLSLRNLVLNTCPCEPACYNAKKSANKSSRDRAEKADPSFRKTRDCWDRTEGSACAHDRPGRQQYQWIPNASISHPGRLPALAQVVERAECGRLRGERNFTFVRGLADLACVAHSMGALLLSGRLACCGALGEAAPHPRSKVWDMSGLSVRAPTPPKISGQGSNVQIVADECSLNSAFRCDYPLVIILVLNERGARNLVRNIVESCKFILERALFNLYKTGFSRGMFPFFHHVLRCHPGSSFSPHFGSGEYDVPS